MSSVILTMASANRSTPIDVAVVIRAADHDLRCLSRGAAEKSADAVRRRSDFFDHLLELFDHLARLHESLFALADLHA
jgi:hypothetical protein